jgi:hypothetical protein
MQIKHFRAGSLCASCMEEAIAEAEQEALEAQIEQDWREAAAWAASLLQRSDWCLLDTETTSLTGYLVELAILDPTGQVLFNRVINPQARIDPVARSIHRIQDDELAAAPTLPEVWPDILQALAGHVLIITYNVEFDSGIIKQDAARYHLELPPIEWECLMLKYASYVSDWSNYWHSYRWQPLPDGDVPVLLRPVRTVNVLKLSVTSSKHLKLSKWSLLIIQHLFNETFNKAKTALYLLYMPRSLRNSLIKLTNTH